MESGFHNREYWDKNLDIQNLGKDINIESINLEEESAFWMTPDQLWVHQQLGTIQGRLIVDIGGGLSVNSLILARQGAKVVVLDISLERLRLMKRMIERFLPEATIMLLCGSAEELPIRDETIHAVLSKAVLIHTNLPQAMREIRRILKPGGHGFFCEPTKHNPFANLYRRFFAPPQWKHITYYFDKAAVRTIREFIPGTEIKHFYIASFFAFFWQFGIRNRTLFKKSLSVLGFIDSLLCKISKAITGMSWFYGIHAQKYQSEKKD